MSTRGLLVAVGLLVLLLGALSFLQKNTPGTERGQRESRRMTLLPVREAESMEMSTAKGIFSFQKSKEGEWKLVKPVETGADGAAVGQLLSEVQFVETIQVFPPEARTEANLQAFGLGQPSRTLRIRTPEGELSVDIGRETPIPGGVYARVLQPRSGERLMVLQNQLVESMDRDLSAWRDKRVFPLVVPEVEEFWMRQGAVVVEVQKSSEGTWGIRKPVEAPADTSAVTALLGEVSALRASEFTANSEGDLALYGLTAPAWTFEVRTRATNRILQVGQPSPKDTNQVFARMGDRPFVFTLPLRSLGSLTQLPDRIRDRRVATFNSPDQITQIEFGGKGGEYRLEKQGMEWRIVSPGALRPADASRIHRWLDAVQNSKANRFLATADPAKLGLAKPRLTATLTWTQAPSQGTTHSTETLGFGEETKDEVYIQNSAITGAMATTVALIRETPENSLGWLERRLLPRGFGPLRGLIWTFGNQRKEYRCGDDGRWRAVGSDTDTPGLAGYTARLANLEVIRWTGAPVKKEFTKPEGELVLEGEGSKKIQIFFGKAGLDGGVPVRISGEDLAGQVTKEQLDWLKRDPGVAAESVPIAPSGR